MPQRAKARWGTYIRRSGLADRLVPFPKPSGLCFGRRWWLADSLLWLRLRNYGITQQLIECLIVKALLNYGTGFPFPAKTSDSLFLSHWITTKVKEAKPPAFLII